MIQDSKMHNIHNKVNKNGMCVYCNGQMYAGCGKYSWKMWTILDESPTVLYNVAV